MTRQGEVLWSPAPDARTTTVIGSFMDRVEQLHGVELPDYAALHRWSVEHLEAFWSAVWDHFDVRSSRDPEAVLVDRGMPDVTWFPGARLNYAEHALRWTGSEPAIVAWSHTRARVQLTRDELRSEVARVRSGLIEMGVGHGDRVAAYLPNGPEAVIAFLAAASIGAIWSSCAPELGTRSVVDRLVQVEPKVLFAVHGYRYGDKRIDRSAELDAIRSELPSLRATVIVPYGEFSEVPDWATSWHELGHGADPVLELAPLPFDHPLAILYSSGTTGLPKPIVHGHGGVLLEQLKATGLQHGWSEDDRVFWFTTTGWMMWNTVVSGLLTGSRIVLFDGDPMHPDPMALWRLVEREQLTNFGVSAGFLLHCRREGLRPGEEADLSTLRRVGSTGSPLPVEGYDWVYEAVGPDVQLASGSGGTDVLTGLVGSTPLVPVYSGEISCALLGCDVAAFDADGQPVVGTQGELVVRRPMPSMPVRFWGDDDGSRLRQSYFEHYPGVWRHGDWITFTERGSCTIAGRSDATLNRGGVRIGTAELYAVAEAVPGIDEALAVYLEGDSERPGRMLLFVATTGGRDLDDELRAELSRRLRSQLSPRHVPDEIVAVPGIPRTLSGKKLEVPVKRLLEGHPPEAVASRGSLANPHAWDAFISLAAISLTAPTGPGAP